MSRRRGLSVAWAIPAVALLTIWLGAWGWLDHHLSADEALYRGMALFDNNNDVYHGSPGSTDWRFLVGRWTGVVTVFGAALFTLAAILRERVVLAFARLVRQQVIIIGAGDIAMKAFEAARRSRRSVVWVGAPALEAFSIRALALPWPPDDHLRTIAGYAAQADHILLAQGDDAAALVMARTAREAAPIAFITLLLEDGRLAEDAAAMFNQPRTRVLSAAAVSARALNVNHPPFLIAKARGHDRLHALIVGFGQTGQAIARDIIINCRTTYLGLPRITVVDPNAKALEGVMRVRAPELDACAEFNFIEGAFGTHGVEPGSAELGRAIATAGPLTAVYVCRHVDAEALSVAGMLQSLLRAADVDEPPIFVRLREAETLTPPAEGDHGLGSLIPFGDLDSIIAASEFLSTTPDQAARTYSAAYRNAIPPERRDDPSDPSAKPWDELAETFRQATRNLVEHIPAKMASAGIDPSLWVGVSGPPRLPRDVRLFSCESEFERLAELEHERWNAQRRMDGWRWAASRNQARRLHPNLEAYDRLDEPTKDYDRTLVRQTQLICWDTPPS
jgi:hypothetical protein